MKIGGGVEVRQQPPPPSKGKRGEGGGGPTPLLPLDFSKAQKNPGQGLIIWAARK